VFERLTLGSPGRGLFPARVQVYKTGLEVGFDVRPEKAVTSAELVLGQLTGTGRVTDRVVAAAQGLCGLLPRIEFSVNEGADGKSIRIALGGGVVKHGRPVLRNVHHPGEVPGLAVSWS
jgi:hypothetical protein